MLKQSTETRTGSGLLLNEPYVDYGVFPVALRKNAEPKEIIFDFRVRLDPKSDSRPSFSKANLLIETLPIRLVVHFAQRAHAQLYSYVRQVDITIGEDPGVDAIILEASEAGQITSLRINDYDAQVESTRLRLRTGRGIVPLVVEAFNDNMEEGTFVPDDTSSFGAFTENLLRNTNSLFHGRTLKQTRLNIFRAVQVGSPTAMLEQMRRITDNGIWNMRMRSWNPSYPSYLRLRNLILGARIPDILSSLNAYLSECTRGVHYFQPIRARVERDYMSRDLQVESVESDGKNVAMFLNSLPSKARKSFQEWTKINFGMSVYPEAVGDGARVALRLREERSGAEFNLADMGFGYSQMLPLLVQIWALLESESIRPRITRGFFQILVGRGAPRAGYIVAIEQPELHLHPAMQARLADLFVNTVAIARKRGIPIRFIIETHSQSIVNRLGHLVEGKRVDSGDVQIILFERGVADADPLVSTLRRSRFDDEGVLTNWPFGFFLPEIDDSDVAGTDSLSEEQSPSK
jgi:hypothetical protein